MDFIRFFLILIVPGIISATFFGFIAHSRQEPRIATTLIFNFWIFIIMITGLYFFRDVFTITSLIACFNYVSFTVKYALLSVLIGIFLAITPGLIYRIFWGFRRKKSC